MEKKFLMLQLLLTAFFPNNSLCDDTDIPLLDFSRFRGAHQEEFLQNLNNALTGPGFLMLKGHGISQSLLDQATKDSYKFFKLPDQEKEEYVYDDPTMLWGYQKMGSTILYGEPGYQEAFIANFSDFGRIFQEHHLFADTVMYDYCQEVASLVQEMLRAFALVLGIDEEFFVSSHGWDKGYPVIGAIRQNYYPPIPADIEPSRFGAHADYITVTALIADEEGLQIWSYDKDEWVNVPRIPGSIIINTGNLMQFWTNDLFKSTLHRVRHSPETRRKPRMSIAFFMGPNPSTIVDPHDIFPDAQSDRKAWKAEEYVAWRMANQHDVEKSISSERNALPRGFEGAQLNEGVHIKTEL